MPFIKTPNQLIKLIIFCSLVLLIAALANKGSDDKNYNVKLQIINGSKDIIGHFLVSVANNDKDMENGLMWVNDLPKNYGMIFEFKKEQMVFMWMKNTKIPLDMLFIDDDGKIVNIKKLAQPESLDIISSTKPVKKVLEINGGLSDQLGIEIGDQIRY